ncbi:MAG: WXG100 family type VII secretion target [Clostridia bacterium]|nr:WXG100 family type VII secretion target [Clostridia bacterium]
MATIKVDSTVMRDKAGIFKNVATSIKTLTDEMTQEIESLRSAWEGESAETTVNKFKSLAATFEEKYETINQYASFLEEAANAYDEAEKAVTQGAEGTQA